MQTELLSKPQDGKRIFNKAVGASKVADYEGI